VPAESHVQEVVVWTRLNVPSPCSFTKTTIAAAKAAIVVPVEMNAATRREMR
jgi:hypothetical protein